MEGWLRGSDCGGPWGPLEVLQGEAPRGDVYQSHQLLQGTAREQSGRLGRKGGGWPEDPFSLTSGCFGGSGLSLRKSRLLGEPL